MNNVVWHCGSVSRGGPMQVLLRYREDPFSAVPRLTFAKLSDDLIDLRFQFRIAGRPIYSCRSREPVPEEMPSYLEIV